jgi:hypothetical protein
MENTPFYAEKRHCITCNFKCSKNIDWERHINTLKHKNRTILNNIEQQITPENTENMFVCKKCNKNYKARNSLWYHEKKCKNDSEDNKKSQELPETEKSDKELIILLLKQNNELQNKVLEICKNSSINNSNNNITHTNSHNKAFNLNFFLNETCKDAMNITDFVESIKLQLSDLERVGEVGYVEGISNIIVKNLKDLDVTQRPVHCTDKKRETMYIKDEDTWEKDDEQKKMHKMVRKVADKNARMLPKFKEAHPDCTKSTSRYSDQYSKIIMEAMGGKGDNDFEKEEKIIKRVSKEVMVEKD